MGLDLITLRKLAILKEAEIVFKETSTGRAWKIAPDGVIKFALPRTWGEPLDFTPEQILKTADEFSFVATGKPVVFNRVEMERFLTDSFRSPHSSKAAPVEEE